MISSKNRNSIMQIKKPMTTLLLLLPLAMVFTEVRGQQTLTPAGGEANGTGGTVSFTTGQIRNVTLESSAGIVSEGVQQPYEILEVTGTGISDGISLDAELYPNPAGDYIVLKVDHPSSEGLSYQLVNMSGQVLEKGNLTQHETRIDMTRRGAATYLLQIFYQSNEAKAFKIIKK
jgi:hypothetical protein